MKKNYDELRYEGFGVSGTMVIIDTLTNNVNRTAAEVRTALGKNGGNLGVTGSVNYMFDNTAVIGVEGKSADELLEILMEADIDARDIIEEDELTLVYGEPENFHEIQEALKAAGIEEFEVAEISPGATPVILVGVFPSGPLTLIFPALLVILGPLSPTEHCQKLH